MSPITVDRSRSRRPRPEIVLRTAGVCAVAGTLAHIVSGVLHGDLTAGTGESASVAIYRHVLATPSWAADNVASLLALLAWAAVFVAIHAIDQANSPGRRWLGQLAIIVMGIGIAVSAVLYLTDVITLPTLAQQWATADPGRQDQLQTLGDTIQIAIRTPLFYAVPILVLGIPFALLGAAHLRRHTVLPTWIAWVILVAGAGSAVLGISWVLGSTTIPELVLWVGVQPLIWIWGITTGIVLWRRARQPVSE